VNVLRNKYYENKKLLSDTDDTLTCMRPMAPIATSGTNNTGLA